MKLYIANGSKQEQEFWYRVPGPQWNRPIKVSIPTGMQAMCPGDYQPEEIDSIVEQIRQYGGIKVDEVDKSKPYSGICYSLDKPVTPPKIEKLFQHNQGILEKRAEEGLLKTVLAGNKLLSNRIEETAREARQPVPQVAPQNVSIVEIPRHGSPIKTSFFSNGKDRSGTIRIAQ